MAKKSEEIIDLSYIPNSDAEVKLTGLTIFGLSDPKASYDLILEGTIGGKPLRLEIERQTGSPRAQIGGDIVPLSPDDKYVDTRIGLLLVQKR